MQKCKECFNMFKYKDISICAGSYAPIDCVDCGIKHYVI